MRSSSLVGSHYPVNKSQLFNRIAKAQKFNEVLILTEVNLADGSPFKKEPDHRQPCRWHGSISYGEKNVKGEVFQRKIICHIEW